MPNENEASFFGLGLGQSGQGKNGKSRAAVPLTILVVLLSQVCAGSWFASTIVSTTRSTSKELEEVKIIVDSLRGQLATMSKEIIRNDVKAEVSELKSRIRDLERNYRRLNGR